MLEADILSPLTYAHESREKEEPRFFPFHALTRKRAALVSPPRITSNLPDAPIKARLLSFA